MAENPIEDVDKESLISLLKDKGKELKTLEGKNKKLEERYIKVFRENKNLVKDRETLEKLLLVIFDQDQEKFKNIESGAYDITALTTLWDQRNSEKLKQFNEALETHKNEKTQFEKQTKLLEEELDKAKNHQNPETEKKVESYKIRVSELDKANEKLNQEIKELNEIIDGRNQEINRLKNVEYEVDALKAELLMKELQVQNMNEDLNIKSKMQENERKNEVLRLRQEIESAQGIIKELQAEKEELKLLHANSVKNEAIQTENQQEVLVPADNEVREPSPTQISHDSLPRQTFERKDSETYSASAGIGENGQVNQEYFKNVIMKLFCYIEGNNLKEAKVLMNAISIMLKMTPEEKEKIEEAKKNNTIWTNTVSFLKDTFTAKGDVNYYTNNSR